MIRKYARSAGGANVTLSNLGTTAINASLLFGSDNSLTVGNDTNRVSYIHLYGGIKRPGGAVQLDTTNSRLNDASGNPSVYVDDKLLRTGTHGAPVTKLDWSGATDITVGAATGKIIMNALKMRLPTGTSDPSSPLEGDVYMNTSTHKLRLYNGTTWVDIN